MAQERHNQPQADPAEPAGAAGPEAAPDEAATPPGEDGAHAPGPDGLGAGQGSPAGGSDAFGVQAPEEAGATSPSGPESGQEGAAAAVEHDIEDLIARARERDEFMSLAQRVQADFDNFRKRAARDARAAEDRGVGRLARELLPALDNLTRALDAAEAPATTPTGDPRLAEGIRLVHSELEAALRRVGIESFSPAGEPFDPNEHEAVAQHPVEGAASGTVTEVFQPGYRLGGSILRPARVVVAA
jgi:molecular chaperone GrpE